MINILDMYKLGKEISQDIHNLIDKTRHSGKQYLGEVVVHDSYGYAWKVKVRSTGNRGRYLKIYSHPDCKQKIRASADGYKSYLQITPDEWEVFYKLAGGVQDVSDRGQSILNRLII